MKHIVRIGRRSGFIAFAAAIALQAWGSAGGGFRDRWVFMARAVVDDGDVAFVTNVAGRAAALGFNGMMLAGMDDVGIWPDWRKRNLAAVRRFCDKNGIEVIPMVWSVGYGTMQSRDPSLAEGIEVADVPYVRLGGKAVFDRSADADLLAGDGGFEKSSVRGGAEIPAGWDAWDRVGEVVAVDADVFRSGERSVRLSAFGRSQGGQARLLRKSLPLAPGRQYAVTGWVKATADFAPRSSLRVQASLDGDFFAMTSVLGAPGTNGWCRFSVPLVIWREGCVNLYVGTWGARTGAVWVDDVRVEDVGVCGVLRRGGCPFSVKSFQSGREYVEGRDYCKVPPVRNAVFSETPASLEISIPKGSAISEGERLLVGGYVPVTVKNGRQCSTCMSEESLYRHFMDSAKGIKAELDPKTWFISMDEIRMGGTCAACRAKNTDMAHILGECVTRQHGIIRKVSPGARICIWSDMFNPAHNAKDRFFCCRGSFAGSWRLIPRDIIIVDWYGPKYGESLPFWRREGFDVVAATYYDAPFERRAVPDIRAAAAQPNVRGAVYTTWRSDYSKLADFADLLSRASLRDETPRR